MSIPVDLDALGEALAGRSLAYLLTVSDDGRPHAVSVVPTLDGGVLTMEVGRRSAANAAARPDVSLLWPPSEPGGYSLIADGAASVDGTVLRVALTWAVLHRPAEPASPPPAAGACASDCLPLGARPEPTP